MIFYFERYKLGLVHSSLNSKYRIKYLYDTREKVDGSKIMKAWGNMRKYKDVIFWRSLVRKEALWIKVDKDINKYIKSCKKITTYAKKDRKLKEQLADPITIILCKFLLK